MCILCVASKWSRRIVTMLPWLIVPLMVLWALSQLLPPGLRLEVTAPRLACVGVVMLSLCWYELLMPRWSEWRARRSLMLHERRKMEAQEAAKWRKEAVRKCRNCFMAYKDQKPVGGKFMCTYCGHLSKRPALDVPGVGIGQFICRKDLRMQGSKTWTQKMFENDLWPGVWGVGAGNDSCIIGWQNSAVLIVFRVVSLVGFCMWWLCTKLWKGGISEGDRMGTERKVGHRRGENGGQESRAEKMKRKAEEKRLARLEKEQMEAEERLQREEVARLVDERRRQRADAQNMEAHVEQPDKGKDPGKPKQLSEEDSKKNKDKGKKDKKQEDSCKVVKVADTGVKNEATGNSLKATPAKPVTSTITTAKVGVFSGSKHSKPKSPAPVVSSKKEKPLTVPQTKIMSNEVKPSAWNRISWAWGKGTVRKTSPPLDIRQPCQDSSLVPTTESEPLMVMSPVLSPTKPSKPGTDVVDHSRPPSPKPLEEAPSSLVTQQPVVSNPDAVVKETVPSAVSRPFEPSVSVYSSFMPLAAASSPVSDAPTYNGWGTDIVSKSTWKMWEAPNLELPRLTQSLASNGLSLHQPQIPCDPSLVNMNPLPPAAANLSGVPISNNMWSNYHAFESTRRIWEDDLHSDSPPPPEFVDCITQEIMKDPVIAADGHSYERAAIEAWLKTHDTSPKTGGVLPSLGSSGAGVDKSLRPNHNLRGQIIEYKECIQRGIPPGGNGWQTTEALKKSRIGSFPGGGSVWAYSSS